VLGAAILLLALLAFVLLRDRPEEKGLRPISAGSEVSSGGDADTGLCHADDRSVERTSSLDWGCVYRSGAIRHLALVYVAFGLSYVIYTTFFARYLQAEGGYTREASGNLWATVGWISVFCGLIWGAISDLIGRKYALALVYVVQAVSYAIFALWQTPTGFTISAIGFGLTAWSVPSIVAATCGDYVGARMAPAALGFVTLFFGLGQAAGPSVAGALADATGSFGPAFLFGSGVASLGVVGSLLLRPPHAEAGS
jgi:sugar phosphate permease